MGKGRQTAPLDVPQCMVFRPTMDEFHDFAKYMEYMESKGAHIAGIAKVVPPKEWIPRKSGYDIECLKDVIIKRPIKQTFTLIGEKKAYQTKSSSRGPMTVKEYYDMTQSTTYKTPAHRSYEDLERKYWKSLSFVPPTYGCDVADSITDPDVVGWNVAKLNTILNYVNEDQNESYAGVTTPYLYFGSWKTTFSWHVEDMDLYAINFLHFGMPKTWYCVPPKYGYLLEEACRTLFPNVASWCSNFMRHKTCLVNPSVLDEMGVPYQKVVQEERDMIIVYPYAYHSGFNHGFNCAESTNFALPRWIEYGKRYRPCDCSSNMVKMNMDCFVKRFQPQLYDKWISGKDIAPHPEDPPEVAKLIMLQAENPEAFANLMRERHQKESEKNGEKIMFYTSTGRSLAIHKNTLRFVRDTRLNEIERREFEIWKQEQRKHSNIIFEQAGGPLVSADRRLVHIYQHVELKQVKVKVLPRTLTVIGDGLAMLKRALPNERFETVKELIDKGAFIKIGERQMKRKSKIIKQEEAVDGDAKRRKEDEDAPSFKTIIVQKTVVNLKHSYMNLVATVFADNLNEYYGEQTAALKTFMEDQNMKELVEAGTFVKEGDEYQVQVEKVVPIRKNKAMPLSKKAPEIQGEMKKVIQNVSQHHHPQDDFVFYNVYRDTLNEREVVINPVTLQQPNIEQLEKFDLFESKTIDDLISEKRLELLMKDKKFRKGCTYRMASVKTKVYKHVDLGFELLMNAKTGKPFFRGRKKKEVNDCLKECTVDDLFRDNLLEFQGERTYTDFQMVMNQNISGGATGGGGGEGGIGGASGIAGTTAWGGGKKKMSKDENSILKRYLVHTDGVSIVDIMIGHGKMLFKFKLDENDSINRANELLFTENEVNELISKRVIESKDDYDLSNDEYSRLESILKCEIVYNIRYRFHVMGYKNVMLTTDETETRFVKKIPLMVTHVVNGRSPQELIRDGTMYDKIQDRGYVGAVGLKKAVLGVETLSSVRNNSDPLPIEVSFLKEGIFTVKNKRDNEILIIKEDSLTIVKREKTEKVEEENKTTMMTPSPRLLSGPEKRVEEENPISSMEDLLKEDEEIDEDDYDDIEDSEAEENNVDSDDSSHAESDGSNDYFSDDQDFMNGKLKRKRGGKWSAVKKKVKKTTNEHQRVKKEFKLVTGRSKNLRDYVELTQEILKLFKGEDYEDITFTMVNLQELISDPLKKSKIKYVVDVLESIGIVIPDKTESNKYVWKGMDYEFETVLTDILEETVSPVQGEPGVTARSILQYLLPMKRIYCSSINELVVKLIDKVKTSHMENVNIYIVIAIFTGLNLIERQAMYIEYIGPDIYGPFSESQYNKYAQLFDLKSVSVVCKRFIVPDNLWDSYKSVSKYQHEITDIVGTSSEQQKEKAAMTGLCQCGTQVEYNGPINGEKQMERKKVTIGQRRKTRCSKCEGCLADKCGECDFCKKPHLKKPCEKRICLFPQMPKCPCFS